MSTTVLEVDNLTFRHEKKGDKQVSGVSFKLRAGRTFGILGGNECGKTTLAQVVLGNLTPEAGGLRVLGAPVTPIVARPRWLFASRTVLITSLAIGFLLASRHPTAYIDAINFRLWTLPLLLLLLEAIYQVHSAIAAGTSSSSALDATETGRAPASMIQRGIAYISSEHDGGQKLPGDSTIEEVIGKDMPLPKGSAGKEAKRREVLAALKASGFQMMTEVSPRPCRCAPLSLSLTHTPPIRSLSPLSLTHTHTTLTFFSLLLSLSLSLVCIPCRSRTLLPPLLLTLSSSFAAVGDASR